MDESRSSDLRTYETVMDLARNTSTFVGTEDFYGHPVDHHQVGPNDWLESVHPDDVEAMMDALDRIAHLKDGECLEYTLRFRHVDGGYVRSVYRTSPIEFGPNGLVTKARSEVRWVAFER